MELWKVRLTYKDLSGVPLGGDKYDAGWKTVTTYVAVQADWNMAGAAGDLAIRGVIGPDCNRDEWMPCVDAAKHLGSVHMEETDR